MQVLPEWDVTATTFNAGAWPVYPGRSYLPAKVRAMFDFCREHIPNARLQPE